MTVAVCIRCGNQKVGAFTTCTTCRFLPVQPEDLAKAIFLSDRISEPAVLEIASHSLRAGEKVEFDVEAIATLVALIHDYPPNFRKRLGCAIVWYGLLVVMGLLTVSLIAIVAYLKW